MNFSDKLNCLMNLYKINNIKLAKGINVDPSLISRWKTGIRIPPQNSNYLNDIARYFLTLTTSSYHMEMLKDILKIELPHGEKESIPHLIESLSNWFIKEDDSDKLSAMSDKFVNASDNAVNIINNITNIIATTATIKSPEASSNPIKHDFQFFSGQVKRHEVYKGIEGKRQAVLNFLNTVLASPKPLELLLNSSEDMRWMIEDKEFLQTWAKTLRAIIDMGHSITIIHVVNRDTSEIMSILNYWMPLHLTGRLKSYYHPKYIDNKLKATYFIIRDTAAIISFSSEGIAHNDATLYFKDPFETRIFEANFLTYLSECKPLMSIYSEKNIKEYYKQIMSLEESTGVSYIVSNNLSGLFIPSILIEYTINGLKFSESEVSLLKKRKEAFRNNLTRYRHVLVLPIELLDRIVFEGTYALPGSEIFQEDDLRLDSIELVQYFETMIEFLKDFDNFELFLSSPSNNTGMGKVSIFYKENYSSSFTSQLPDGNPIAVVLNETNILNSLELYFEDFLNKIPSSSKRKDMVIEKLYKVISILKNS